MSSPSLVELVIFDCDGVLVDSEGVAGACLAELLTEHGLPTQPGEVAERFLGRSMAAVEEAYRAALGRELPDGFRDLCHARIAERFPRELKVIPAIEGVLRGLDGAGVPYCLASSSERPRIELSLEITGLAAYFAGRIFNAAMVARGKPAPDLFLHAAAAMGVPPGCCLVVEDSVAGVTAGKAAGMAVWGFVGGSHYSARDGRAILLAAGADRVIETMAAFDLGWADGLGSRQVAP